MTIPNSLSSSKKQQQDSNLSTISSPSSQLPQSKKGKDGPAAKKSGSDSSCASLCGFLSGLVLVGFLISALFVYQKEALDFTLYTGYHDGDQIVASQQADSFSSLFCLTYTVDAVTAWSEDDQGASFYLTDGPATIHPELREEVEFSQTGLRSREEFDYRAFYLLPGSLMETRACLSIFNEFPSVHAEVLFIKGTDCFTRWINDASCDQCVAHRVTIFPGQICGLEEGELARYFVEEADTYYIVITRQHRAEDYQAFRADVRLKVVKTLYDVTNAKERCLHQYSCKFNLTYNSDDEIVVQFPFRELSPDDDNSFNTDCGIRMKFFLTVFLLIPTCLIFLLTLLCCICSPKQETYNHKTQLQKKKAETKAAFATPRESVPPV